MCNPQCASTAVSGSEAGGRIAKIMSELSKFVADMIAEAEMLYAGATPEEKVALIAAIDELMGMLAVQEIPAGEMVALKAARFKNVSAPWILREC